MILAIDVGNTETTIGIIDDKGEKISKHWRLTTNEHQTSDEMGIALSALLGIRPGGVNPAHTNDPIPMNIAICSVVPTLTPLLSAACREYLNANPTIIDASTDLPIKLDVEEPLTVGADRIVNTLAASRIHKCDTIVVDLGTATTYDCITADGTFLGGVIQPGIRTSAETLFRKAAKLSATELVAPRHVIGKRTDECIRAGVIFGAADSIDGIVGRIKAHWPNHDGRGLEAKGSLASRNERETAKDPLASKPRTVPLVVATGGLAEALEPYCTEFDLVDPYLTLRGLALAVGLLS